MATRARSNNLRKLSQTFENLKFRKNPKSTKTLLSRFLKAQKRTRVDETLAIKNRQNFGPKKLSCFENIDPKFFRN